jgi:thiosulfate/3-mercaptopyruvate sulfurtransferase
MFRGPLIDVESLAQRLGDPSWIVVDCRFNLLEPSAGRAAYAAGHVPGARYADLDRDLAKPPLATEGRHPLPTAASFAAKLGEWGIGEHDTVVVYDDGSGAIAARLWWLLGWLGHARTLVLDGGFAAWQRATLPIETTLPAWQSKSYPERIVATGKVVASADVPHCQAAGDLVVDARATPRYRGETEPIDPVAGHVPGARNWPFSNNVTATGLFRPAPELHREFTELLDGRNPEQVIAMCGSGVTACHLLLAMAVAGLEGGKLFAGSWSEWIRDPARPIATGGNP